MRGCAQHIGSAPGATFNSRFRLGMHKLMVLLWAWKPLVLEPPWEQLPCYDLMKATSWGVDLWLPGQLLSGMQLDRQGKRESTRKEPYLRVSATEVYKTGQVSRSSSPTQIWSVCQANCWRILCFHDSSCPEPEQRYPRADHVPCFTVRWRNWGCRA